MRVRALSLSKEKLEVTVRAHRVTEQQALHVRAAESLQEAEDALADWQQQWDEYTDRVNEARQQRNIEQTRSEQIESRIQSFTDRRQKLDEARSGASAEELQAELDELTAKVRLAETEMEDAGETDN